MSCFYGGKQLCGHEESHYTNSQKSRQHPERVVRRSEEKAAEMEIQRGGVCVGGRDKNAGLANTL